MALSSWRIGDARTLARARPNGVAGRFVQRRDPTRFRLDLYVLDSTID